MSERIKKWGRRVAVGASLATAGVGAERMVHQHLQEVERERAAAQKQADGQRRELRRAHLDRQIKFLAEDLKEIDKKHEQLVNLLDSSMNEEEKKTALEEFWMKNSKYFFELPLRTYEFDEEVFRRAHGDLFRLSQVLVDNAGLNRLVHEYEMLVKRIEEQKRRGM